MNRSPQVSSLLRSRLAAAVLVLPLVGAGGRAAAQTEPPGLNAQSPRAQVSSTNGAGASTPDASGNLEHPLMPAIRLATSSLETVKSLDDYQCTLIKRELLGAELQTQTMQLKLRHAPFSVYLAFDKPVEGREVLFVEGQNNGQLLVHEGSGLKSLVGTVSLATDSPEIRAENRHPITDLGMQRMLEILLTQWELESGYGETNVVYYPDAKIGGVSCPAIECSHPRPRKQFRFHVTRLYIDSESQLPVRVENYGFPEQAGGEPPLVEEYTYVRIRTNTGLQDDDFSRTNPDYKF